MKKILLTLLVFAALFTANTVFAENLIQGGTFENVTESDFTKSGDKITAVANNSVYVNWKGTSWILGLADESFSGDKALHILQTGGYYPVTFKANLERGAVYKFSAYIKCADPASSFNANLCATTPNSNTSGWSNGTDIKTIRYNDRDGAYKIENPWSTTVAGERVTISGTEWTLVERIICVEKSADENAAKTITAYMGLAHSETSQSEYYIDDVSLVKLDPTISICDGYSKVYAAKGKTMSYTYRVQNYHFTQGEILWSLEGDTENVSINGGTLTVGEEASGNIKVIASLPDGTAACSKDVEIVPFTANNIAVNVNGKPLNGFSVENENYVYEYRGDTIPKVTATGNQSIVENENTVFVEDTTKTYDIIFKKLPDFNENLFYDGGFEEGVVNSAYADLDVRSGTIGITTENNNVHSGRYALKVSGNQYTTLNLKTKVQGGKLYRVSMWVKNSSTSGTNSFFPCFYKDSTDTSAVQYYYEAEKAFIQGYLWGNNNNRTITVKDQWQKVDRLIHVSDTVDEMTLKFGFTMYADTSVEYYVDDVSIYELEMSDLGGAYMGAVYRTANGEMAKTILDADHIEFILYNPQLLAVDTNILIAEYESSRLLKLTKEQFTSSELVKIVNKPITLQDETDNMSILAWDTGFAPDIKASSIE